MTAAPARTPRVTIFALALSLTACGGGDKSVAPPVATSLTANSSTSLTGVAGAAVTERPSVIVKDQRGDPMAGVPVTFAVTAGGGTITGNSVTTNASGVATVGGWTLGTVAGLNSLTASTSGLSPVTFTATGTAGAAASVVKTAGDAQTATAGSAVSTAPAVTVRDANGNPVSGVTVAFAVASGGGSVAGPSQTTNSAGIATVGGWTLGTTAGSNSLTATAGSLAAVTFTTTGTAGLSAKLALLTAPSSNPGSRIVFSQQPTIRLQDANGNVVNLSGVTVLAVLSQGGGTLMGDQTANTDADGVASFLNLGIGGTVGARTLTFSSTGLASVMANVTLGPGLPALVFKNAGDSQYVSVGKEVPSPPSVRVTDADGNGVTGTSVSFTAEAGSGGVSGGAVTTSSIGVATVGGWALGTSGWQNLLNVTTPGVVGSTITFSAFAFPPWTEVALTGPQSDFATGVTYNRKRGRITLIKPSTGMWEIPPSGGLWTRFVNTAPGTGRVYLAVHEATQRVLMISDQQGPSYWDYSTNAWSPANTGDVPTARYYPALAYDSANARVLMYGGIIDGGSSNPVAEVYSWDGTTWMRLADSPAGPRAAHRMAYDPSTGNIFVHGGTRVGNPFGGQAVIDTWVITRSGSWQQLSARLNQPLAGFGMAWDEGRQSLVLAGGTIVLSTGYQLSTQIWELTGGQWRLSDASTPVGARVFASMMFAPSVNGILLYGNEAAGWNDLWLYAYP